MIHKLMCFARAYAKAIGALAGYTVTYLVGRGLDLPVGLDVAAPAAVTAFLVYMLPNTDCAEG